jgi:glutaminyl-peptide cyclotransferase
MMKLLQRTFVACFCSLSLFIVHSCNNDPGADVKHDSTTVTVPEKFVPVLNYTVVRTLPHDSSAFTEGFFIHEGNFYESTGSPENYPGLKSVAGIIDTTTGRIDKKVELDRNKFFGEGTVILGGKLYQLTYTNQVGFIYDAKTFKQLGRFSYDNKEGWGLTTDGTQIIMSDGTNTLTWLDPATLKPVKKLPVSNGGYAEDFLNELEYIKGFIYANIWMKNYIVKIDPSNGHVVATMDLSGLMDEAKTKNPDADVLNGIAYDSRNDKIYVTGKLWKNIYELKFDH